MRQSHILGMACGYYLSRFDEMAYERLGFGNKTATHEALGRALGVKAQSIKNWRDEFDPIHDNPRNGWHNREMLPTRARMASVLSGYDHDELYALVIDATKETFGPAALVFLRAASDVEN